MSDVLSQSEIDELIKSVQNGEIDGSKTQERKEE